jgi:metal-dependent HD superfamily phosphatase/phosphodiesterase
MTDDASSLVTVALGATIHDFGARTKKNRECSHSRA